MKYKKIINPQTTVLGHLSPAEFIQGYWQQQALLVRDAMPFAAQLLAVEDLLAMACASECESRLVTADRQQKNWRSEPGPFTRKHLKGVQSAPWTLLVQAVDQWIPDVAAVKDCFAFLPRWRLDDIMISLANEGGGVGPHFDYYDVFLLQVQGQRRWQLGQHCDEQTALRDHPEMKLLKTFTSQAEYVLQPGDMLYVPAGLAHWGTSLSEGCITLSIGFRAASQRELIQIAMEKLAASAREHLRYQDSAAAIDRDPFCINEPAGDLAQQLWKQMGERPVKEAFAQAMGIQATEPRYPEHIQPPRRKLTEKMLHQRFQRCGERGGGELVLQHHVASRFAYRPLTAQRAELYVNGEVYLTRLGLARALCHQRLRASDIKNSLEQQLLLDLFNQGLLAFGSSK